MPTIAPQVWGLYEELNMDPASMKQVVFELEFPSDYSTLCMENVECFKCDRNAAGCDTFLADRIAALNEVL